MICRRASKCEPLLRFKSLNLAKIACFAKWVKGAKCVSLDFLNERVSMILTCIILKTRRYGASVHFGVVVVELINRKCGGIVRNQTW